MLYLATPSGPDVRAAMSAGHLGCMTTPAQGNRVPPGAWYAADNGRFGCDGKGRNWPGLAEWRAWLTRTVTRYGVRDVVVSRLGEDYLEWRRAVIRLKEAAQLYDTDPKGVEFVDRGLFRAEVKLPTVAPTGKYYAEVWLFQDGEPKSVSNLTLTVEKVGLERDIYEFAHRRPWLYGVLCVILAALTGYGASRIFSRRS